MTPLAIPHVRTIKTHIWFSRLYPGVKVEYIDLPGAPCQPIPGVGPEPATVEIVDIRWHGHQLGKLWPFLKAFSSFDEDSVEQLEEELKAEIAKQIPN